MQNNSVGVWRSVEQVEQVLRHGRLARAGDRLTPDFLKADLAGKAVVDLGCNIGFYSYLAGAMDARRVLGLDVGKRVIATGRELGRRYGVTNVELRQADFLTASPHVLSETFDVALMIDVIGNNRVGRGNSAKMLEALTRFDASVCILAIRPVFEIEKHLRVPPGVLRGVYPNAYISKGYLYFLDYLRETWGHTWDMEPLSGVKDLYSPKKQLVRFVSKQRQNQRGN